MGEKRAPGPVAPLHGTHPACACGWRGGPGVSPCHRGVMQDPGLDVSQPFTLRQWIAAGHTDHQLRGQAFRRLFRGCFVSAATAVTPELLVHGALLMVPGATFATHHTAARLLGGIVPDESATHLGAVGPTKTTRSGIVVHRYRTAPQLVRRGHLRMTSPTRTFLDLTEVLGLVDLVILGDSLTRRHELDPGIFVRAAASWRGRGARRSRAAAALVRPGVDSPMETRSRLLLVMAGLPEPTVNIKIRNDRGDVVRRIDLGHEAAKLAIEYDGRQHVKRQLAWSRDILRREDLENDGWRFVIFVSDDIHMSPAQTLDRVVRAMRAAGMSVPRLKDDWRPHFPGRGAF